MAHLICRLLVSALGLALACVNSPEVFAKPLDGGHHEQTAGSVNQAANELGPADASAGDENSADNKQGSTAQKPAGIIEAFLGGVVKWIKTVFLDPIATFTAVLSVSTIGLWSATRRLWEGGERQTILAQRPRLRIRNSLLKSTGYIDPGNRHLFLVDNEMVGEFTVANVGGTKAIIQKAFCGFFWTNENPQPPPNSEGNIEVDRIPLQSGETREIKFGPNATLPPSAHTQLSTEVRYKLYIMGWIDYADELGHVRRTGFCRMYDKISMRFLPTNDSDYEYED